MLEQAQKKVDQNHWRNVTLVQSDVLEYCFPEKVDGVISTFALSLIPDLAHVLEKSAAALTTGGRLALLELQLPDYWPGWLSGLAVDLMKPFAVTDEWVARQPWKMIQQKMNALFKRIEMNERYLGFTYIIAGEKSR